MIIIKAPLVVPPEIEDVIFFTRHEIDECIDLFVRIKIKKRRRLNIRSRLFARHRRSGVFSLAVYNTLYDELKVKGNYHM